MAASVVRKPKIERLVDFHVDADGVPYYQVKWAPTWERADSLVQFQDVVDQFWDIINKRNSGNLMKNNSFIKKPPPELPPKPAPSQQQPRQQAAPPKPRSAQNTPRKQTVQRKLSTPKTNNGMAPQRMPTPQMQQHQQMQMFQQQQQQQMLQQQQQFQQQFQQKMHANNKSTAVIIDSDDEELADVKPQLTATGQITSSAQMPVAPGKMPVTAGQIPVTTQMNNQLPPIMQMNMPPQNMPQQHWGMNIKTEDGGMISPNPFNAGQQMPMPGSGGRGGGAARGGRGRGRGGTGSFGTPPKRKLSMSGEGGPNAAKMPFDGIKQEAPSSNSADSSVSAVANQDPNNWKEHFEVITRQSFDKTEVSVMQYVCKICSVTLTAPGSCQRHYRKHFGVEMYKCPVCGKGFHRKDSMRTHVKTHKNNASGEEMEKLLQLAMQNI